MMYIAVVQNYEFNMLHYFIIPIVVYLGFFGVMFKSFKNLLKELL